MKKSLFTLIALTLTLGLYAGPVVDSSIPHYKKVSGVRGTISSVGSDTLLELVTYWCEDFHKIYPGVTCQIEGKGSSTAPPALISGASNLGPMSRKMKSTEMDAFVKSFGYRPLHLSCAIDTLAVYVNKDNPIESLSIPRLDAIFSKNRNCGYPGPINTWKEAGVTGSWASHPITLYGRNSASGTYGYFKKHAMCSGDYRDTVKEQPGSASVVQGVGNDLYGIGYSGIGYKTSGVKAIALSKKEGAKAYPPTVENALSRKYPLARALYLNLNKAPGKPLPKFLEEFIRFALSYEGQELVIKAGYIPLPKSLIEKQMSMIEPGFSKYSLLRLEKPHHLWLYSLLPPLRRGNYAFVGRRCV